jgi:hypothetical protein
MDADEPPPEAKEEQKQRLHEEVNFLRAELKAQPKGDHRQRRNKVLMACEGIQADLNGDETKAIRELGFDSTKTMDQLFAQAMAESKFM